MVAHRSALQDSQSRLQMLENILAKEAVSAFVYESSIVKCICCLSSLVSARKSLNYRYAWNQHTNTDHTKVFALWLGYRRSVSSVRTVLWVCMPLIVVRTYAGLHVKSGEAV